MVQQRVFDFQRRDLVAAGFDDIDRRAAKDAVVAVFDDGDIAGAKPAIDEAVPGGPLVIPIALKDGLAPHPNLSRHGFLFDGLIVFVEKLRHHARKGLAHESRSPLAVVRIGNGHAGFRGAVAFQQRLAGQLLPARKDPRRAGGRAGNVQPHSLESVAYCLALRSGKRFDMLNQLHVNSGHRHEHGEDASGDLLAQPDRIQLRHRMHGCAAPQRATQHIDNAVQVMQRQKKRNAVVARPPPGFDQHGDLRADGLVREHRAFGPARGAAGEYDHRRS